MDFVDGLVKNTPASCQVVSSQWQIIACDGCAAGDSCGMLHVPNDHSHGFHDSNPFNTACICMYRGQFLRQVKYKPSDLWLRYIIEKEPFCGIKTFQSCVTFSCMFVQVAHTIIDLSGWSSYWVVHLQEATNPLGIVALSNFVQLPFEKGKI